MRFRILICTLLPVVHMMTVGRLRRFDSLPASNVPWSGPDLPHDCPVFVFHVDRTPIAALFVNETDRDIQATRMVYSVYDVNLVRRMFPAFRSLVYARMGQISLDALPETERMHFLCL